MSLKFPITLGLAILGCGALSQAQAQPAAVSPLATGARSVYVNEEVVVVHNHRRHGHYGYRWRRDEGGHRRRVRIWIAD